jgi:hypothetical protein
MAVVSVFLYQEGEKGAGAAELIVIPSSKKQQPLWKCALQSPNFIKLFQRKHHRWFPAVAGYSLQQERRWCGGRAAAVMTAREKKQHDATPKKTF